MRQLRDHDGEMAIPALVWHELRFGCARLARSRRREAIERYLDEEGQLEIFHAAFARAAGESWLQERDAWEFHRDEVIEALTEVLGQSEGSVEKWVDGAEDNFSLTIENFAKWVKRYLDRRGPDHRIMFLADEVGQFIGSGIRLRTVAIKNLSEVGKVLDFIMGKNTPQRRDFIVDNLVTDVV